MEIVEELKNKIEEEIKKDYPDVKIIDNSMIKNNNVKVEGITIRADGEVIAPVYWLSDFVRLVEEGKEDIETVARSVASNYKKIQGKPPRFPELNRENAEKMLFATVVNTKKNKELLEDVPHMQVENLSIIPRFGMCENCSVLMTTDACAAIDMSPEETLEVAIENTNRRGYVITHISKILLGKQDRDCYESKFSQSDLEKIKFFVITNTEMSLGAAIPFVNEEARQELREKIGGDYYLIPSSVHECLAIDAEGKDAEDLKEMVVDINEAEVKDQEVLSNNVYFVGEDLRVIKK